MIVPHRGFEVAEFTNRCAKAQLAMATDDIGALLLTSEADIRYFTGFMTQFWQSPTRPWFVLIPASGKPVAIIPSIGVPLMR
ncbi:MAG: aminopeptidase P family N-terminal domain-containing protein, partial [Candidatus Puniceispirillaceae bacterium]